MKNPTDRSLISIFFAALLLMSCTKKEDMPPEITIDRTACARCRMLISDSRFAASLKSGSYLIFDDIGCMLEYSRTHIELPEASVWVRDFGSDKWIRSIDADFYLQDNKQTPMGYGFIALRKGELNPSGGNTLIGSLQQLKAKFATK